MRKILTICLLSLCFMSAGVVSAENEFSGKVGGVPIVIPKPTEGFQEVGYDNRELMEILVPPTNRLICAFLTDEDLAKFGTPEAEGLSRYMMVQIARQGEFTDLTSSDFADLVKDIEAEMADIMPSAMEEVNEEMGKRLKDLDIEKMEVGQPEMLGKLFAKPDASSLAMMMPLQEGTKTTKMICSISFIRLNNKLLFAYVYGEYEGEETLAWVKDVTQKWVDAMLLANQ